MLTQVNHSFEVVADVTHQLWLFLLSPNVALELLGKMKPFAIPCWANPSHFRDNQTEAQRDLVTSPESMSFD